MITIQYAKLNSYSDIPAYNFDNKVKIAKWVDANIMMPENYLHRQGKIVFLLSFLNEVIISDNKYFIDSFFTNKSDLGNEICIHEYSSFESAYNIALLLKEESPLCYDDKSQLN